MHLGYSRKSSDTVILVRYGWFPFAVKWLCLTNAGIAYALLNTFWFNFALIVIFHTILYKLSLETGYIIHLLKYIDGNKNKSLILGSNLHPNRRKEIQRKRVSKHLNVTFQLLFSIKEERLPRLGISFY